MFKAETFFTFYLLVSAYIATGLAEKLFPRPCDRLMFDSDVEGCLSDFNESMEASGFQDRCLWPAVKGIYNQLKNCVDNLANLSWCRGSLVDEIFLRVHRTYFTSCGQVQDPPLITLVLLIAPAILVTILMPVVCAYLTPVPSEPVECTDISVCLVGV